MRTIEYKGEMLPVHFGIRAVNEFSKAVKKDFNDIINNPDTLGSIDMIVPAVAIALSEGARKAGQQKKYSEEMVWDMLDEQPELISQLAEIFSESMIPLMDRLGNLTSPQ